MQYSGARQEQTSTEPMTTRSSNWYALHSTVLSMGLLSLCSAQKKPRVHLAGEYSHRGAQQGVKILILLFFQTMRVN